MIGHRAARLYLEKELPPVSLLIGPPSIGKWTLAEHLARHHNVRAVDRWAAPYGMSVSTAREIIGWAMSPPVSGPIKLITAKLDSSPAAALNAMLKTLEEPPPYARFLLIASGFVPATVASRSAVFSLGMLTDREVAEIYVGLGYTHDKARRAATHAHGQVARGRDADIVAGTKNQVATLAKALATGDRELLDNVTRDWDHKHTEMLTTLFTECLTRRWREFTEQDAHGLHTNRDRLWSMVTAIGRFPNTRPRLAIRAALEPFTQQS